MPFVNGRSSLLESCPTLPVQNGSFVSIEHPGILQDSDAAIASLGGHDEVQKLIGEEAAKGPLSLHLNPQEPSGKVLQSTVVDASDVLLRVTVSKRTGRKRKRGSNDPFIFYTGEGGSGSHSSGQPEDLLHLLQSRSHGYTLEAIGLIKQEHRIRVLPDFGHVVHDLPIGETVKQASKSLSYEGARQLRPFDFSDPPPSSAILPPSQSTPYAIPMSWNVESLTEDATESASAADSLPVSHLSLHKSNRMAEVITIGASQPVPAGPSYGQSALAECPQDVRDQVRRINEILADRPVIARRLLAQTLHKSTRVIDRAVSYCGYRFDAGPWHDTVVRFGCDPRQDPNCAMYQVMTIRGSVADEKRLLEQLSPEEKTRLLANNHVFDGVKYPLLGRTFQLCDIVDGQLAKLLRSEPLLSQCDWEQVGWYHPVIWNKVHTIMKAKMIELGQGNMPKDSDFAAIIAAPNNLHQLSASSSEYKTLRYYMSDFEKSLLSQIRDRGRAGPSRARRHVRGWPTAEQPDVAVPAEEESSGQSSDDDLDGRGRDAGSIITETEHHSSQEVDLAEHDSGESRRGGFG